MGGFRWCSIAIHPTKAPSGINVNSLKKQTLHVAANSQASTGQASDSTVTLEQERLVADHVTVVKDSSTVISTRTSSSQDVILVELQKISQRFTKLEEQTSKYRSVLSELVNHLHSNHQNPVTQHIVSPESCQVHLTVIRLQ